MRIKFNGASKIGDRSVKIVFIKLGRPAVVVTAGIILIKLQRAGGVGNCALQVGGEMSGPAAVDISGLVVRVEFKSATRVGDGTDQIALCLLGKAPHVEGDR